MSNVTKLVRKCRTEECDKTGRWESGFCPRCRHYHSRVEALGAEWIVARMTVVGRWNSNLLFASSAVRSERRKRHG